MNKQIKKNKFYICINISALIIGIVAFVLIALYIKGPPVILKTTLNSAIMSPSGIVEQISQNEEFEFLDKKENNKYSTEIKADIENDNYVMYHYRLKNVSKKDIKIVLSAELVENTNFTISYSINNSSYKNLNEEIPSIVSANEECTITVILRLTQSDLDAYINGNLILSVVL